MFFVDSDEFGGLRGYRIGDHLVDELHKFDPFLLDGQEGLADLC